MSVQRNPCRYCASSFLDERTGRRAPSFKPECKHCVWENEHKQYLQSKRKFVPGEAIDDINTLLEQEWVMFGGRTKHIEVIKSMPVRTILMFLKGKSFAKAIRKEKEN